MKKKKRLRKVKVKDEAKRDRKGDGLIGGDDKALWPRSSLIGAGGERGEKISIFGGAKEKRMNGFNEGNGRMVVDNDDRFEVVADNGGRVVKW
ncbi:hypothetical protein VNO77_22681 [Canavalia gladiata]|uniref:Uncharacterized protein n=1 Tax=Canavalia gladiata TaxID=3824 RepID=A0AAN9L6H4_CANGL